MLLEQSSFSSRGVWSRMLAPLVGWFPDVTAWPRPRRAVTGAVLSVLVHLLILLLFVAGNMVFPHREERVAPALSATAAPLQVELVPMPADAPRPPVPKRRMMLDANGLQKSDTKVENAEYESDRDMVAGSERPATGLQDLPSQDGRTDLPSQNFANQDLRLGVTPTEEPTPPDAARAAESTPATPQPANQVKPLYQPQPVAKEQIAQAEQAKPTDALPEPAKTLRATPPPLKVADKPTETTLAMMRSTPPPPLKERVERAEPVRPAPPQPPATLPRTPSSITNVFQENLRKTGVEGAITSPGKNGVNAVNSPMGRYRRRMGQQIESLWNLKRQGHFGDLGGTVRIQVKIQESGRLEEVRVVDDGHNPRHTEICLQAVREMKPEQMPPEAAPLLDDGALEITFSFTLY